MGNLINFLIIHVLNNLFTKTGLAPTYINLLFVSNSLILALTILYLLTVLSFKFFSKTTIEFGTINPDKPSDGVCAIYFLLPIFTSAKYGLLFIF